MEKNADRQSTALICSLRLWRMNKDASSWTLSGKKISSCNTSSEILREKKCITSFPFRQTDDYKAYEKFSLTMGIFTIGEDWLNFQIHQYGFSLSTFLLYIFLVTGASPLNFSAPWLWSFLVHPRVKTSLRDICGSPSMTMGQCNVLVKWVKWWIYMD